MIELQPAVKKETRRIAVMTAAGVVLMWIAFFAGHLITPESIPFDYKVILGGLAGGAVAVLNFLLMAVTVQKAANAATEDEARMRVKSSYSQRLMLQILWVILAIVLPCFQFAAGIAPLLFPSLGIKFLTVTGKI